MEYYSAIKKELNYAIFSNIDGPRDYHSIEVSQTENPSDRGARWAGGRTELDTAEVT